MRYTTAETAAVSLETPRVATTRRPLWPEDMGDVLELHLTLLQWFSLPRFALPERFAAVVPQRSE